jgi:ABC-type microcin C transport system permease subunit YejE
LQEYQPVISRKAWIIIGILLVALLVYIILSGTTAASESTPGFWSNLLGSVQKMNSGEVGSIWKKGITVFSSIPSVALLIVAASLSLWTLDTYFTRLRHHSGKMQA